MITARTKSRTTTVDQSALAKSAAWAWFQHGSATDGQPESDALRSRIQPKPSRYKLEASKHEQSSRPLLDSYEIERISRQLQFYVESSRAGHDKVARKKKAKQGFWGTITHVPACGSSVDDVVGVMYSRQPEKVAVRGRGATRHNPLNVVRH